LNFSFGVTLDLSVDHFRLVARVRSVVTGKEEEATKK
jgi:hypothetical protein